MRCSPNATPRLDNHTFEHRNLDDASSEAIEREIEESLEWAAEHGVEFEPQVVALGRAPGSRTWLPRRRAGKPNLAPALAREIRFLACDASRPYAHGDLEPDSRPVPAGAPFVARSALAIPRYPTALAHDVATAEQMLDRLEDRPSS